MDGTKLAHDSKQLSRQLQIIRREAALLQCAPVFLSLDALCSPGGERLAVFDADAPRDAMATASSPISHPWWNPPSYIHVRPLQTRERAQLWSAAIRDASTEDAELLATMYPLAPALIGSVGRAARRLRGDRPTTPRDIRDAVGMVVQDAMAGLATRVVTSQSWDDSCSPR